MESLANWAGAIADFHNIVCWDILVDNQVESFNDVLLSISGKRNYSKIIRSRRKDKTWCTDDPG